MYDLRSGLRRSTKSLIWINLTMKLLRVIKINCCDAWMCKRISVIKFIEQRLLIALLSFMKQKGRVQTLALHLIKGLLMAACLKRVEIWQGWDITSKAMYGINMRLYHGYSF